MSPGSSVDFRVCRRGKRNAPSSIRLDHGVLLVMDGLAQSEDEHSTSLELQGPRVDFTYRWISQRTPNCRLLRGGACWALPTCVQGLPGLDHRGGEGAFSMPSLVWVFPLAGNRCVPRTGVRLRYPLGVALPAPQPCFSSLPHSGATCSSARAGALDWGVEGGKCRGGVDRPNGRIGNTLSKVKKSKGKSRTKFILSRMRTGLYARVAERGPTHGSDDMHMILIGTSGVRVGQGQKCRRTHCPTHGIWGLLTVTGHIRQRFLGVILWMLRIGEARHPEPRLPLCGNF